MNHGFKEKMPSLTMTWRRVLLPCEEWLRKLNKDGDFSKSLPVSDSGNILASFVDPINNKMFTQYVSMKWEGSAGQQKKA